MKRYYICDNQGAYSDRSIWYVASETPLEVARAVIEWLGFSLLAFEATPVFWQGEWASLEDFVRCASMLGWIFDSQNHSQLWRLSMSELPPPKLVESIGKVPEFVLLVVHRLLSEQRKEYLQKFETEQGGISSEQLPRVHTDYDRQHGLPPRPYHGWDVAAQTATRERALIEAELERRKTSAGGP